MRIAWRVPLIALLALRLLFGWTSVAHGAELVSDGSFEQPVIDGVTFDVHPPGSFGSWKVGEGSLSVTSRGVRDPAAGDQFVSFNLNALAGQRPATLYQDVATTAGARYHLRFAYAGIPRSPG